MWVGSGVDIVGLALSDESFSYSYVAITQETISEENETPLNYRHAFHAGNHADVLKHAVLVRLILYLTRKPAPFRVIDTHAGPGLYDLGSDEAVRSPEWREGIARLMDAELTGDEAALLAPYLDLVRAMNPGALVDYPGSPLIVRRLMRGQDALAALELHPADHAALAALFARDRQVKTTMLDGWLALKSQLPPRERRGLVLVDPPYEEAADWERLAAGLAAAHARFATGVYCLWYPLKAGAPVAALHRALRATGIARILVAELTVRDPAGPGLAGSGLVIVNPPYTLEGELGVMLPALSRVLAQDRHAAHRVVWLRGEG